MRMEVILFHGIDDYNHSSVDFDFTGMFYIWRFTDYHIASYSRFSCLCKGILKSLNADEAYCETLNQIINFIFESNNDNVSIEVLLIDYDDRIVVNMKDEGKREVMADIEKRFSSENVKVSEVLDLNNIEYVFDKVKG